MARYPEPMVVSKIDHLLAVAKDIGGKPLQDAVRDALCEMCDENKDRDRVTLREALGGS